MSILFGHPAGNPNSYHAALAHFESGRLEAFCVPWMPTPRELSFVRKVPGLHAWSARLERRCFSPLLDAPRIENRLGEWARMAKRALLNGAISSEALAYQANDWLMRTMACECRRPAVNAVHSYEDCSLQQFEAAKKLGKACLYDMPIGFYPAWEKTERQLAERFADWLPAGGLPTKRWVRPEQKQREMDLADLVLVPSTFVRKTIVDLCDKPCALAPYGVDSDFWRPSVEKKNGTQLRFIYAGQISIRKGIPVLLEAWGRAALREAELILVGPWQLAKKVRDSLTPDIKYVPSCSSAELREHYQASDVFVFPSFFEGFALVLLEAMACGLPVISTERSGAPDIVDPANGWLAPAGDLDAWVSALRFASENRDRLPQMRKAARATAERNSWQRYRRAVSDAVSAFV